MERKLATILAADVAGYSRLVASDEEGTLHLLKTYRSVISGLVGEHSGRIFGTAGDSVIAEFASPVQAVRCAVAIQRALHRHNVDLPEPRRMAFRIGVNLGDVIAEGDDLLGDGVNIAARLQQIAEPAGICISVATYHHIQGKATFPVSDIGEKPLKNIPRPVRVFTVDWKLDVPSALSVLEGDLALPDRPSIAVLPFNNMSGDPEQEYFADGITEDIITALSQYRWFFVIARNSTFAYKGRSIDVKRIARELGVRYVLEGSVRKSGARVRVTGQLVEAESGTHLWAARYDRDFADIFAIQDEITESVVGAIEPEILLGEGQRAARKPVENLDALDCCMRGVWHYNHFTPEETKTAIQWLRRSIQLDPNLARAHMYLARVLGGRCWYGFSENLAADLAENGIAAERAVALDERDPYCHYALAFHCMMSGQHQRTLAAAQRALDLSPNFALGYFALGFSRVYLGHFEQAVDPLLRCLRLSPNDPMAFLFLGMLALTYYHLGRYAEAAECAERALRGRRIYTLLRTLVASLGRLGRTEEAEALLEEMERIKPADFERFSAISNPYASPEHADVLAEGLRQAGAAA